MMLRIRHFRYRILNVVHYADKNTFFFQIEDLATRESLRRNSLLYSRPRMDFLKQLEQQSKSWLMEEMEGLIDAAASFIDRALDYDPRTR